MLQTPAPTADHADALADVPAPVPFDVSIEVAWRALDEVDFGLALLQSDGKLHHANQAARGELARARYLHVADGHVLACDRVQGTQLLAGLRRAGSGHRQMVMLRRGGESLAVACVPLQSTWDQRADCGLVLLMLGRQAESQRLAMAFFARVHSLTPAEENVLRGLCAGLSVQDIARSNGTAIGTVRTQVRTLRDKTAAPSIRCLLQRVASLPPLVPLSLTHAAAQLPA